MRCIKDAGSLSFQRMEHIHVRYTTTIYRRARVVHAARARLRDEFHTHSSRSEMQRLYALPRSPRAATSSGVSSSGAPSARASCRPEYSGGALPIRPCSCERKAGKGWKLAVQ